MYPPSKLSREKRSNSDSKGGLETSCKRIKTQDLDYAFGFVSTFPSPQGSSPYEMLALDCEMLRFSTLPRRWVDSSANSEVRCKFKVLIRGQAQTIWAVGKNMAVLVLRGGYSMQCILTVTPELVSRQMVKFAAGINWESIIDIKAIATIPQVQIKGKSQQIFGQFLLSEDFVEIQTPKLIVGASEGGSAIFKPDYKGKPACLAQSPQLHKKISIYGDFGHVFEIGPVFRAENSYTHRHLCEFTSLDFEMEIEEHYFQDAGIKVDPLGDLDMESERKLGQFVLEK